MHYSNTFARTPDVKYIFSHAGGTVPYLAGRFSLVDEMNVIPGADDRARAADTFRYLYWDTALSWTDPVLAMLRSVVGLDHVLFGTITLSTPRPRRRIPRTHRRDHRTQLIRKGLRPGRNGDQTHPSSHRSFSPRRRRTPAQADPTRPIHERGIRTLPPTLAGLVLGPGSRPFSTWSSNRPGPAMRGPAELVETKAPRTRP